MMKKLSFKIIMLSLLACLCVVFAFIPFFSANAQEEYEYKKSDVIIANSGVKEIKVADEFLSQYHVNNNSLNENKMLVPKSQSGIGVYSSGGTIDFSYKNAVNFSDITANDCLIEVYPLFGDEYAKIQDIKIILTDTEDSSNSVAIYFDDQYDSGAIYSRVQYRDKDIAYRWSDGFIFNGSRGIWLQYCTLAKATGNPVETWGTGTISPFNMHLDYSSKIVSASYYTEYGNLVQKDILDVDDPTNVGSGAEWKGFTNDTAYISVQVNFSELVTDAKPGGVIVKSIKGINIDGDFASEEDVPAPDIMPSTQKEYGDNLPSGAVDVEYNVPSVFAFDWFFGIAKDQDVSYVIEKYNGESYEPTSFVGGNGGAFTPTEAGDYKIKYTVKNQVTSQNKEVFFKINQYLPPIMVSLAEDYATPKLNEYFAIPETAISGGSGNLVKKETLYYCGQEMELTNTRDIFLDKAGIISLKVDVSGYCGEPYEKYFPIEVQDGIVIKVGNMPKAILGDSAQTLTLPKPVAYNTADGSSVDVSITVDGANVGEDRTISTNKLAGEELEVKYTADSVEKLYRIKVIESNTLNQKPSSFMMSNGNTDIQDNAGGVLLQTSENGAGATWIYPVTSGYTSNKLQISLSQITNDKLDFEYVEVVLSDVEELQRDFYIRIYKDNFAGPSSEMSSIKINGKEDVYEINGAINGLGTNLLFSIDGYGLYNSKDKLIYDFSSEYSASLSYLSVKFYGVNGQASIRLDNIGNQSLGFDQLYGWSDSSAILSLSDRLDVFSESKLNKEIVLPSCLPVDLTSTDSSVSLTVKAPDGTKILNGVDCSNGVTFTPTLVGEYVVEYSITDGNGNFARKSYYILVQDQTNPVLTIKGKLKAEIKQGAEIVLPTATAVDAVDGQCAVSIFIRDLSSYNIIAVKDNEFTFDKMGRYEVIYQTHDNSYNYTQYIFTVKVVEA